jgi:hypothetical protein
MLYAFNQNDHPPLVNVDILVKLDLLKKHVFL